MAAPIPLRPDYDGPGLRALARQSRDAGQTRRLLALASIYDGDSRSAAAKLGGVGLQIVRDWVLHFNAQGPDGLIDRKAPGQAPKLNASQCQALAAMVERGPIPAELATVQAALPPGTNIEVWWQDEARVGQKNKITRRWAKRGTRPVAPHDQRTQSAYIFGAICPERGVGAALVLPRCDTQAMQRHLDEIAFQVAPGAHALLMMDQAGWHTTDKLAVPANITFLPLPPRSPELNPVENIWQFVRENWLSNRVFESCEQILALCCHAWNKLIDQPWKIMSIGRRKWAHQL